MTVSKAVSPALTQPPLLDEPKRAAAGACGPEAVAAASPQVSGFAKVFKALSSHFSKTNVNVSGLQATARATAGRACQ